jgi:hypothetical protein
VVNASEEGRLSVLIALADFLTTVDNRTPYERQARHLETERLILCDLWWIPFPLRTMDNLCWLSVMRPVKCFLLLMFFILMISCPLLLFLSARIVSPGSLLAESSQQSLDQGLEVRS